MLVLTRKVGESIKVGDDIYIRIVQVKGKQVRIGVEAPRDTKVQREELSVEKSKSDLGKESPKARQKNTTQDLNQEVRATRGETPVQQISTSRPTRETDGSPSS